MALWSIAALGTRPIGGVLAGLVADALGPRFALGFGAVSVVIAVAALYPYMRRARSAGSEMGDVVRSVAGRQGQVP
jgi:hypothetical protein